MTQPTLMRSKRVVLFLVALACGAPAQLSAEELTAHGGCADVFLYALTKPDTLGVTFSANGLLAEVGNAQRTFTFQLPDSRVKLERLEGTRLSSMVCSDLPEGKVERRHGAVSGTATLTLHPAAEPVFPQADLQLKDVVFEVEGQRQTLPALELTHITVGWFPG